jgi:hypothetical protein
MALSKPVFSIIFASCIVAQVACTTTPRSSTAWKREVGSLPLLPIGLEHAEITSNAVRRIEGSGKQTYRFMGLNFFEECYNSMPKRDRIWYAIFYSAGHILDGEYQCTFRLITVKDRYAIQSRVRTLTSADWKVIGTVVQVNPSEVRERVYGEFYLNDDGSRQ